MNPLDEQHFVQLMAVLGETFGKEISSSLAAIYFRAFESWPIERFEEAVNRAVVTLKFFPKPVELIELVAGDADDHRALAEEAWQQLWKALSSAGTYRSLFCEDRILAETIRRLFGDWPAAGMIPRPDSEDGPMYQVRHKEFLATYVRLLTRQEAFDPYLMGRIEGENSPQALAAFGQALTVTYLPRTGHPEAVELRALMPDHPLVALMDRQAMKALTDSRETPQPPRHDESQDD